MLLKNYKKIGTIISVLLIIAVSIFYLSILQNEPKKPYFIVWQDGTFTVANFTQGKETDEIYRSLSAAEVIQWTIDNSNITIKVNEGHYDINQILILDSDSPIEATETDKVNFWYNGTRWFEVSKTGIFSSQISDLVKDVWVHSRSIENSDNWKTELQEIKTNNLLLSIGMTLGIIGLVVVISYGVYLESIKEETCKDT